METVRTQKMWSGSCWLLICRPDPVSSVCLGRGTPNLPSTGNNIINHFFWQMAVMALVWNPAGKVPDRACALPCIVLTSPNRKQTLPSALAPSSYFLDLLLLTQGSLSTESWELLIGCLDSPRQSSTRNTRLY